MRWEDLPESRTSRIAAAKAVAAVVAAAGGGFPGGAGGLSIGTVLMLGMIG